MGDVIQFPRDRWVHENRYDAKVDCPCDDCVATTRLFEAMKGPHEIITIDTSTDDPAS